MLATQFIGGKELGIFLSSACVGVGGYLFSGYWLEQAINEKGGVFGDENPLLVPQNIPLLSQWIGIGTACLSFICLPPTFSALYEQKIEPGCYYGLASVMAITGLSIIQDCPIIDLCSKAIGAYMIGFASEGLIPTALSSLWEIRTSSPYDVLRALGSAALMGLGWPMLKFRHPTVTRTARQLFGGGLILGGLYFAFPQALRNSITGLLQSTTH
jgi:hypothetical protein